MELESHFLAGKTIVVAGGGMAGLTFVAALQKLWNPARDPPRIIICERDSPEVAAHREGYSLSLAGHDDTGGLVALANIGTALRARAGSFAITGHDRGSYKIWGADWTEYFSFQRAVPAVRIARRTLRRLLYQAIQAKTEMKWEAKCISAKQEHGNFVVQVLQGPEARLAELDCDLLIAADGASSKLRASLRPDDELQYSGAVLRGGLSRFQQSLPAPLDQDWGFMLSGTGVSCFYSPVDQRSVMWAVGRLEDTPVSELGRTSREQAVKVIAEGLRIGSRFKEPFASIVDKTDLSTVMLVNAKDKMPFAHDNLDDAPVVFIGDANHALHPFAGYGANLAICDGWDLAESLCSSESLKEAVAKYDAVSVPRARKVVEASRSRLRQGHAKGLGFWAFIGVLILVKIWTRMVAVFKPARLAKQD